MKWFGKKDLYLGVAVLGLAAPLLYAVQEHQVRLLEREAQASLSVLQACTEIAAYARAPFSPRDGVVKEQCLLRFDERYAAAHAASAR